MGTRRLYDFIDNNPMVAFYESDYVNSPFVVAQNRKMVAINQALELDLTGQVCSDSLGYVFYSGLGGQADFVRGARMSEGGKAITVLPSTAKEGSISRIRAILSEGAGVALTRGDVDYVVTEYGVAHLTGRAIKERALSLMSIAHPKFRNELLEWAKEHKYVPQEVLPFPEVEYPEELKRYVTLEDGTRLLIRPIKPSDATMKQHLFYALSKDSVAKRYLGPLKSLSWDRVWPYVIVDYQNEMVLVAVVSEGGVESMVGIGSYSRIPRTELAEVALVVRDDWQGKGIGTELLKYLIDLARSKGFLGLKAWVLVENTAMMHLFKKCGYQMKYRVEDSVYEVFVDLRQPVETP
jgi:RimJ/RimL family protein N-acetyltransferase